MEGIQNETDPGRSRPPVSRSTREHKHAGAVRASGLKKVRRVSNWSLAALVVGVGATTGALTHTIHSPSFGTTSATNAGTVANSSSGTGVAASSPSLTNAVATTSASGVTTLVAKNSTGMPNLVNSSRVVTSGSGDS